MTVCRNDQSPFQLKPLERFQSLILNYLEAFSVEVQKATYDILVFK